MSYTKQTWTDGTAGGTPVSSARLNYIESGIATADNYAGSGTAYPTTGLRPGILYTRTDLGYTAMYDGTQWVPQGATAVYGKLWRTMGFSGNMTANTDYAVIMDAGRAAGGFTQAHDTSGTAWSNVYGNSLTVPLDGIYEVTLRGYGTGGPPPYDFVFYAMRGRSGTSDLGIVTNVFYKETGQDRMPVAADRLPLKAGDKLAMRANAAVTGPNYWGTTEVAGVMLSAYYAGPLNGATPV